MSGPSQSYAMSKLTASRRSIHVVIESGLLYFVVQLLFVVMYGVSSVALNIILPIAVQTYVSLPSSDTCSLCQSRS